MNWVKNNKIIEHSILAFLNKKKITSIRQTHPLGHGRPPVYTVPPSAAVSSGTTGKYGSNFRQYGQLTYSSYLINKFTIILYLLITSIIVCFNNENFKFTILFIVVPYSLTSLYGHDAPNMSLHFPIASLKLFNFGEGENKWVVTIIIFSSCWLKKLDSLSQSFMELFDRG